MKLVISGILDGSKSKYLFSLIFAHGGGKLNLPDRDPVFRHHGIHPFKIHVVDIQKAGY